jgi:hypothetical protein
MSELRDIGYLRLKKGRKRDRDEEERRRQLMELRPEGDPEKRAWKRYQNLAASYTGSKPMQVWDREHALAAAQAYESDPLKEIGDYDLVGSNEFTRIYKHKKDADRHLIGIRGTKGLPDVGTDVSLAVKDIRDTDRYKASKKFVEDYFAQSKRTEGIPRRIEFAGHSLGGVIADRLGQDFGADRVVQFNSITYGDEGENTEHYVTEDDPLVTVGLLRDDPNAYRFNLTGGHTIDAFANAGDDFFGERMYDF